MNKGLKVTLKTEDTKLPRMQKPMNGIIIDIPKKKKNQHRPKAMNVIGKVALSRFEVQKTQL